MRYAKGITKISLCCGMSSLFWQDTIERAVGHYTVSRDYDVTDQECGLSFPDHLPCPRQDGGRKWAGDETTYEEAGKSSYTDCMALTSKVQRNTVGRKGKHGELYTDIALSGLHAGRK